jgi:stage II sporulation protein M
MRKKASKKREKGRQAKFKRHFYDSIRYLRNSLRYVLFVFVLFVVGGIVGFVFAERVNEMFKIEELLRKLVEKVLGMNTSELIFFIFQNNAQGALYGLVLGIIFGVFPLVSALGNGVVLGYVMKSSWQISGISDFWRILPHGVFELVAVFIALGLGVKLGFSLFTKKGRKEISKRLLWSLIIFVCVVLPLLILAAVIEGMLIGVYK